MKFKTVALFNFRSFRGEHEFSFTDFPTPGFIFLTGENRVEPTLGANGAGKSSLWEAIHWCLYGKSLRGLRAQALCCKGEKGYGVELDFEIGGKDFTLRRMWSPNELSIVQDDKERPVTQEELDQITGVTESVFKSCIVVGQFERMFFDLSATEKLNLFTSVLDLEKWVRYSSKAAASAKSVDAELRSIEADVARVEGSIESLDADLDEVRTNKEKFVEGFSHDDVKADLEKARKGFEEVESLVEKIKRECKLLDDKVEQFTESTKKTCFKARDLENGLSRVKGDVRELEASKRRIKDQIRSLTEGKNCPTCGQVLPEEKTSGMQDKLLAAEADLDVIENTTLPEKMKELKDLENELKIATKEEREVDKQLAELTKAKTAKHKSHGDTVSEAQAIKNRISLSEHKLQTYEERVAEFNKSISAKKKQLKEAKEKLREHKREQKEAKLEYEAFDYWRAGFKEIRLLIISDALASLEASVNSNFEQLGLVGWKVRFDVERANTSGGTTKGFTVLVQSPDSDVDLPWEAWSGGEGQRLRIAGMMGLIDLISSFKGLRSNIEVWDEPSQHLSQSGIEDLLEALRSRARKRKQIWLVDHRSHDAGQFDGAVSVVKDETTSTIETL